MRALSSGLISLTREIIAPAMITRFEKSFVMATLVMVSLPALSLYLHRDDALLPGARNCLLLRLLYSSGSLRSTLLYRSTASERAPSMSGSSKAIFLSAAENGRRRSGCSQRSSEDPSRHAQSSGIVMSQGHRICELPPSPGWDDAAFRSRSCLRQLSEHRAKRIRYLGSIVASSWIRRTLSDVFGR